MDLWSKDKRSQVMSRILAKNTKPEQIVRKMLTALGYRYYLHIKELPGKPDIVLTKHNAVIFVHGCFWHLHNCRDGTIPKTRMNYWEEKLRKNQERDRKHSKVLRKQGWKVLTLWECEIEKRPQLVLRKIVAFFNKF